MDFFEDYDYLAVLREKDKLKEKYPYVSVETIGKSVMGREIFALSVGQAEENALFIGGFCGVQRFSVQMLIIFFNELCKGIAENGSIEGMRVRRALSGRALTVIPCINPDGCEISSKGRSAQVPGLPFLERKNSCGFKNFRLNARGIDIDLNFCGKSAFSEPESLYVKEFLKKMPVRHAVFFGSGKNEIVSPFGEKVPERSRRMAEIMVAATGYDNMNSKENPEREGFLKWFYETFDRPAFKVLPEFCETDGKDKFLKVYKELRELMMLSAIM